MHVVDNFYPALGGLERAVGALTARWCELGVQPVVLTGWRAGLSERERIGGVEIVRIPSSLGRIPGVNTDPDRVFFPPVQDPLATRTARRAVEEFRPDLVHGHGWMLDALHGAFSDVPTVAGWHDFSAVCARKSFVRDGGRPCPAPSLKVCLGCAAGQYGAVRGPLLAAGLAWQSSRRSKLYNAEIAISKVVAGQVPGRGATVVPTFVDDQLLVEAAAAPRPDFAPEDVPYLVYAGQLTGHKGLAVLLEAHRRLLSSGTDVALLMLGLPMPGFSIETLIAGDQQHRVTLVERVPHEGVLGAMRHAAAGVVPSVQEALGQVAIEMLAAGCPPIVSAGTGLAEVVDGRSGLTFPAGDLDALTAAARQLLTDETLAARFRAAGPARAAEFTLGRVLPQLLDVYDRVLGEPFLASRPGDPSATGDA